MDEQKLVSLYVALTGSTEQKARSVFMWVCSRPTEFITVVDVSLPPQQRIEQPGSTDAVERAEVS